MLCGIDYLVGFDSRLLAVVELVCKAAKDAICRVF